jgi:ABC-type lipoprotein export system ATPase subunit
VEYSATDILEILKRLNEDFQKAIVMVTHDPHVLRMPSSRGI